MIQDIASEEELQLMLEQSESRPILVFKHSTRCGVSSYAWQTYQRFCETNQSREVDFARVLVVEDRSISLLLADKLGVMHQSPQIILVKDGAPMWTESHYGIVETAISEALQAVGV
jgi:bacillithiol system protein YtxJ